MLNEKDVQPRPVVSGTPTSLDSANRTPASIGPNLKIKGDIAGHEDLRLQGKIEGTISLVGHRLDVESTAHIHADIVAREVVVAGEVIGNINAPDRIELKKGGSIVGDLTTGRLVIEDGAFFKGAIEIGRSNTQTETDPDTLVPQGRKAKMESA